MRGNYTRENGEIVKIDISYEPFKFHNKHNKHNNLLKTIAALWVAKE
jgi:hypothetical protein